MMYRIVVEEAALNEIQQVYSQYTEASLKTASNFEAEIEDAFKHLKSGIADYREVLYSIRAFPLPAFPFNIYYRRVEEEGQVQIIALLHARRSEDFVSKRLSGA